MAVDPRAGGQDESTRGAREREPGRTQVEMESTAWRCRLRSDVPLPRSASLSASASAMLATSNSSPFAVAWFCSWCLCLCLCLCLCCCLFVHAMWTASWMAGSVMCDRFASSQLRESRTQAKAKVNKQPHETNEDEHEDEPTTRRTGSRLDGNEEEVVEADGDESLWLVLGSHVCVCVCACWCWCW